MVSKLLKNMIRVVHPGSRIRMLTFSHPGSRIKGSKSTQSRIPDPDPQHCIVVAIVFRIRIQFGLWIRIIEPERPRWSAKRERKNLLFEDLAILSGELKASPEDWQVFHEGLNKTVKKIWKKILPCKFFECSVTKHQWIRIWSDQKLIEGSGSGKNHSGSGQLGIRN